MIIWLASFPRSGNSFFRVVSRNLFDREVYSIYPEKNKPLNPDELEYVKQDSEVFLVKTHELPSDSFPAIYLVRDGRDSLVSLSWFNLASRTSPNPEVSDKEFQKRLKNTILSEAFGGWSNNCQAWAGRSGQTTVVRFEDLIAQPEKIVAEAFAAIDLEFLRNEKRKLPSFEQLHSHNPFLYRKGKVGGWQDQMSEDLHGLFWKKHGKAMHAFGYPR